jgi:chromosome partitioning protein
MVDANRVLRPPANVTHVVLDTPAGLSGTDLQRAVMSADAVLMPVCDSAFDREAVAHCWAEMRLLPRVASGRCRVAAVGMRIDTRTRDDNKLRAWAQGIGLPFLGVLRDTKLYVRCIERGLTIFDLPEARTVTDREQWQAVLDWLDPLWASRDAATPSQADALAQIESTTPPAPKMDAEGRVEAAPVRVSPPPRRAAADPALAAALTPRAASTQRGWFKQTFGWLRG